MSTPSDASIIIAEPQATTESISSVPCAICRRQFSKYTCPKCNIPYCSLTCFRSENHGECSEAFYRHEIQSDINAEPSKTAQERLKMMELLKRFEEDSLDDSALLAGEDESEESTDLANRLADLDVDAASYEELWDALTPSERDKFLQALDNPSGELAQQLLSSEELEEYIILPWWEASIDAAAHIPSISSPHRPSHLVFTKKNGVPPELMQIPSSMVKPPSIDSALNGPPLLYNICAVCITYAYATRLYSTSPLSALRPDGLDQTDAVHTIDTLTPFLTAKQSTMIHPTLSSVITDIWARLDEGKMNATFFSLLLRDAATLVRPLPVTVVSANPSVSATSTAAYPDLESHPSTPLICALSDVAALFRTTSTLSPTKPATFPATPRVTAAAGSRAVHKLTFYAAHVLSTPTFVLRTLADEVVMRSQAMEAENTPVNNTSNTTRQAPREDRKAETHARIEVLT